MRRLIASAALLTMAALVSGCAFTDYCGNEDCTNRMMELLGANKATGCASLGTFSAQGNPQKPVVDPLTGVGDSPTMLTAVIADPLQWVRCANRVAPANNCQTAATFGPPACILDTTTAGAVPADEAATWTDILEAHAFVAEAQVFGATSGTWVMAGVQSLRTVCDLATGDNIGPGRGGGGGGTGASCGHDDAKAVVCHRPPGNPGNQHELCVGKSAECAHLTNHPDDSSGFCGAAPVDPEPPPPGFKTIRLTTWGARNTTGAFSCHANNVDGLWGNTEGGLLGDGMSNGRIPGLTVEAVALENNPTSIQFGRNVRATTTLNQSDGFNVFVALTGGRIGEGRHEGVTPSAGLQELFGGAEKTISFPNEIPMTWTITAGIREDGMIDMEIHRMTWRQQEIRFSTPLLVSTDTMLKKWAFGREGQEDEQVLEQARFMEWFANTALAETEVFNLDGAIPELGLKFPPIMINVDRDGFLRRADDIFANEDRRRR